MSNTSCSTFAHSNCKLQAPSTFLQLSTPSVPDLHKTHIQTPYVSSPETPRLDILSMLFIPQTLPFPTVSWIGASSIFPFKSPEVSILLLGLRLSWHCYFSLKPILISPFFSFPDSWTLTNAPSHLISSSFSSFVPLWWHALQDLPYNLTRFQETNLLFP